MGCGKIIRTEGGDSSMYYHGLSYEERLSLAENCIQCKGNGYIVLEKRANANI